MPDRVGGSAAHGLRLTLRGFLLLMLVATAACGGTDLRYTPSIGVTALGEEMNALSLTVVANEEGAATLVGTLLNHGTHPDRLVGVSARSPSTVNGSRRCSLRARPSFLWRSP